MNSEEFDIQIKELLQDAEERVSPAVWEGVEAGLNKYHRLVFWRRSAVAVAAAAAVAGAFVFLEPDKHIQEHSNPTTISVAEAQVAGTPLRQQASPAEETAAPAEPLATRRSRLAAIPSGTLAKICERELNWKRPTTYTVLRKLCEKGLFTNADGLVQVKITREQFYSSISEQFVEESFSGSLPAFIAAFTANKPLTDAEADEIMRMIASYRKERES